MRDSITKAISAWRESGVKLLPGIDRSRIAALERESGIELAADAVRLYSLCGGMPANEDDGNLFELWSLERAINEAAKFPAGLLPFAEGFISSHLYLLRRESAEVSSVHVDYTYSGKALELVADSLDAAFAHLLSSPDKLHLPK